MKRHTLQFILLPANGSLLGIQADEVQLEAVDGSDIVDGWMFQFGLIFFKVVYVYVPGQD